MTQHYYERYIIHLLLHFLALTLLVLILEKWSTLLCFGQIIKGSILFLQAEPNQAPFCLCDMEPNERQKMDRWKYLKIHYIIFHTDMPQREYEAIVQTWPVTPTRHVNFL